MTIIIMTITAFFIGLIIILVDSRLKKEKKEEKELIAIEELLPGLNCGACGYGSCKGMSEHLLEEKENYKKCRPLRGEKLENFLKEIDKHL